jgi:hypothetical protein
VIITVEVPDQLARQYHLDEASRSRQLLEAFLLQRFAEGELTTGQVGAALGLSFHETEQFLQTHHARAGLGPEEHLRGLRNLKRALAR